VLVSLGISAVLILLITLILYLQAATLNDIGNFLFIVLTPTICLIIMTRIRGVAFAKGILETRLYGDWPWFRKQDKKDDKKLKKLFVSTSNNNESKLMSFFRLFVNFYGFCTFLMVSALQLWVFIGMNAWLAQPTKPALFNIETPIDPITFVQAAYLFGIVFSGRFVIPSKLLSTANLRIINEDDTIVKIPSRDWNRSFSAMYWIASFALVFFNGIFVKSMEEIFPYLMFGIIYVLFIALPILIFCIFYARVLEPKLKQNLMRHLTQELKIRHDSVRDPSDEDVS
jgi:hypothetical protein